MTLPRPPKLQIYQKDGSRSVAKWWLTEVIAPIRGFIENIGATLSDSKEALNKEFSKGCFGIFSSSEA